MPGELELAVNDLERREDPDSVWRCYVNTCLAGDYQTLFSGVDYLLMLRAPSFRCVADWRGEQEKKLAQRQQNGAATPGLMDSVAIQRFIQHYERLTTHCLNTLPASADCVMSLGAQREILAVHYREEK
jgi:D-glycerate 3-kinase